MEIRINTNLMDYQDAALQMEDDHVNVSLGNKPEIVWLLEHDHVYTRGISAKDEELLTSEMPVYKTKRGGRFTYHGPGQQICYLVINLRQRSTLLPDIRHYVRCLEEIVIRTLSAFGIVASRKEGYIGIWVCDGGVEKKIAAIGVKFSKGVTMHGFAMNIAPDLIKFNNIIPCGIKDFGVCSMKSLGIDMTMESVRKEVVKNIMWAERVNFYQS